jgi:hypothetical protein
MKPYETPKHGNQIVGGLCAVSGLLVLKTLQGPSAADRYDSDAERRAMGIIGLGLVIVGVGLAMLPAEAHTGGFGSGPSDDNYEPFEPDGGGDAVEPAEAVLADEDVLPTEPIEGLADNADEELAELIDSAQALA